MSAVPDKPINVPKPKSVKAVMPAKFLVTVVGVSYAPGYPAGLERLEEAYLAGGESLRVQLARDYNNPVDPNAVAVFCAEVLGFDRIGYVPKDLAARLAVDMDMGIRFIAQVAQFRYKLGSAGQQVAGVELQVVRDDPSANR